MSSSSNSSTKDYPLPVYNYKVSIDNQDESFSEINGLAVENYEILTYTDGLSFMAGDTFKPLRRQKAINLTFKRAVFKGSTFFYDWLKDPEFKKIDISLCDSEGTPLVSWSIREAYPVKITGPEVNASSKEVAIESLEVLAFSIDVTNN